MLCPGPLEINMQLYLEKDLKFAGGHGHQKGSSLWVIVKYRKEGYLKRKENMSQMMLMAVAPYPQEQLAVSRRSIQLDSFCIHTLFPADRIPHRQMEIHMVLQLFPKMLIVLQQCSSLKHVLQQLSWENISNWFPQTSANHQVPIPSNHCSDFYHHWLVCFFWNFIYMESLYSLCPGSNVFKFIHVADVLEGSSLLWLSSSIPLHRYSIICFSIFLVVIIMAMTVPFFFIIVFKATVNILYIFVCVLRHDIISLG